MEAFSIHVHHTGKLNFHNWTYFDKNELSVSASGRLVHRGNGVLLESRELAEQYKDAITARRIKSGDREFDAEVECVSGSYPEFSESIKKDSEVIRQKLEAWNYPTPQNQNIVFNGYAAQIQEAAGMIDENVFSQPDVPTEIGVKRGKYGGAFINGIAYQIAKACANFIHIC